MYTIYASTKGTFLLPFIIPILLSSLKDYHVLLLVFALLLFFLSPTVFTLVLGAKPFLNGRILGFIHHSSPFVRAVALLVLIVISPLTFCIAFRLMVPLPVFNVLTSLNVSTPYHIQLFGIHSTITAAILA